MSLNRVSTRAMRTNLRPASFHTSRIRTVKFEGKDMDDQGGPFGQTPPPQKPGGPEAVQRNWVPIVAGAFAVGAGFWYMTSPKQERAVSRAKELEHGATAKAGELTSKGAATARELENNAKNLAGVDSPKSMKEMSGRKADSGFRSE